MQHGGILPENNAYMLTMIMNEQQTMPYYLSDEIASKPYNHK
jgi:hypothetical protein